MWNISLPPKLEIHGGNNGNKFVMRMKKLLSFEIRQIAFASSRLSPVLERKRLKFIMVLRSQAKKRNSTWRRSLSYERPIALEKNNVIYERYKFNNRWQEQTESIEAYVNPFRALIETCDFRALKDQLIRDRFVCGVRYNAVRRKLLLEYKLALEKCVDICRAAEDTYAQLKEMAPNQQQQHSSEVDLVTQGYSWKSKARKENVKGPKNHQLYECKFCDRKLAAIAFFLFIFTDMCTNNFL
mgnify:FL=1